MKSRPKPKEISWLRFFAIVIIFYAFLFLLHYFFQAFSAPAIAYDQKQRAIKIATQ